MLGYLILMGENENTTILKNCIDACTLQSKGGEILQYPAAILMYDSIRVA